MEHSPEFLALVEAVRPGVTEVTVDAARAALLANPAARLVDVREDHEWRAGHADGAHHLGRGIIERDIRGEVPDKETELFLYCGGGFRSALAAHQLQLMGYRRVRSIVGGYKAMKSADWPMVSGE
jgi:rhodanese-related sulfurtransferase